MAIILHPKFQFLVSKIMTEQELYSKLLIFGMLLFANLLFQNNKLDPEIAT